MHIELWTSAFCAPCAAARRVVAEAGALVEAGALADGLDVTERDVAAHPDRADETGIRSTPTIIVHGADGTEVFRAVGVPTRDQLLVALARAV